MWVEFSARFEVALRWLGLAWVLIFAIVRPATTQAANINVLNSPGLPPIIVIEGSLDAGDDKKFVQIALPLDQAIVGLNSPGGNVLAAIEIGRAIRLKQFTTFVPADTYCASACGLAWLGGTKRVMASTAHVGFHAAYVTENGQVHESGAGNAIVGAYLNQLGLSQNAIAYLTSAPPDSLQWLTANDARQLGIEV